MACVLQQSRSVLMLLRLDPAAGVARSFKGQMMS